MGLQLLDVGASVADGTAVDWDSVGAELGDDDRELLEQLRIVAGIAALHRSLPELPEPRSARGRVIGRIEPERSMPPPLPMAEPPRTGHGWGHYELVEQVGEGAFGEVFRAIDLTLQREAAVKLFRPRDDADRTSARMVVEGRALAQLRHPNIVTVYGAESHDGRPGLCMEFIRGQTLDAVVREQGPLSATEASMVVRDVCGALSAVHAARLVHRDVKARNVMREQGGRIVLMDFGTGQYEGHPNASAPGLTGTPLYLAPELLEGRPASVRSDVYSVGTLLFFLVTGSYPVQGTSLDELREVHRMGTRRRLRDLRPTLPDPFIRVVERAIAANPDERYATAGEMREALVEFDAPVESRVPATPAVPTRRSTSPKAAMLAAACVALVGAAAWLWTSSTGAPGTPVPPKRLAVAPLVTGAGAGDATSDPWRAGFEQALIGALGRVPGLETTAFQTISRYRREGLAVTRMLEELRVDAVLVAGIETEGSDRRLRVSLETGEGQQPPAWGRTYALGSAGAILPVLPSLAADLSAWATGSATAPEPSLGAMPTTAEAEHEYFVGLAQLYALTREGVAAATQHLERAVLLDAGFAPAHGALAYGYLLSGNTYGLLEPERAARLARRSARAALALDADQPDALMVLGSLLRRDWDWSGSNDAYQRAIRTNPSYTMARSQYAMSLAAQRRLDEAVQQIGASLVLDPAWPTLELNLALLYYYARDYDGAAARVRAALERHTDVPWGHFLLARILEEQGRYDEALAMLETSVALQGRTPSHLVEMARTLALAGRHSESRAVLAEIEVSFAPPEDEGYVLLALGEADRAFETFMQACRERSSSIPWVLVDPRVDALRADPRFPSLVSCLGLAQ
jgi:serine/threonine-protein kinase